MATVDSIRNTLISKLLTIKDQSVLAAIDKLISSSVKDQQVEVTAEQMLMLEMSSDDLKHNRVISQEELFESEKKWLNGK